MKRKTYITYEKSLAAFWVCGLQQRRAGSDEVDLSGIGVDGRGDVCGMGAGVQRGPRHRNHSSAHPVDKS